MSENYYNFQLYPLQDKVLQVLAQASHQFYLTGDTALSRQYLDHRYSDDLDFFLNRSNQFAEQVHICFEILQQTWGRKVEKTLHLDSFARGFIRDEGVELKIEFVNDVPFRVGTSIETPLFIRTDTIINILSNKISALSRRAAKYFADIWCIALKYPFYWKAVIEAAQNKDASVDETEVLAMLKDFNVNDLLEVKWTKPLDLEKAKVDMDKILIDVLWGKDNSLCKK